MPLSTPTRGRRNRRRSPRPPSPELLPERRAVAANGQGPPGRVAFIERHPEGVVAVRAFERMALVLVIPVAEIVIRRPADRGYHGRLVRPHGHTAPVRFQRVPGPQEV